MSAGCVHTKASVILAVGFLSGSLAFGSGVEYAIGALAGIPLSPDLDVDAGFHFDRIIRNKVGHWAEWIWDKYWEPYRASLKHGGPLSHAPVVSTLFRLVYILFTIALFYVVVYIFLPDAWNIWEELSWWIHTAMERYRIILGLIGSDTIHWVLDVLTKEKANANTKRRNPCTSIIPAIGF